MIDTAYRWARRIWKRPRGRSISGGLVLLYHRIAENDFDPWSLCVTPGHFTEQLQVLKGTGLATTLPCVAESLHESSAPRRSLTVTFDDGYADNVEVAKPLLEQHEIPATFFVTSGSMREQQEFWWDELEKILLHANALPEVFHLLLHSECVHFELGDAAQFRAPRFASCRGWRPYADVPPTQRHALYCLLYERFKNLEPGARDGSMKVIRQWAGIPEQRRASLRSITPAEVAGLAGGPLFDVGAHTVNHPFLSRLDPCVQHREIAKNKAELEEIVGRPIASFAYPHGDYSEQTVDAVRRCGFRFACTTAGACINQNTDLFELPRFAVEDWDGDEFAKRLRAWLQR
jgi:peptidoglycan/xylan/chitin deacetylase (PgdA/CDA1 family)